MTTIIDFHNIVIHLIELLEALISIEKDKLESITSKNLDVLNNCIKNEQVLVLKLKGLDKKREQILSALGYDGLTYKEIISRLPAEEKEESSKLFATLQKTTDDFHAINDSVKVALDVNLHVINTTLSKLGQNPETQQIPSGSNLKNRFA